MTTLARHNASDLDPSLEREAIALTAEVFGDMPALHGRYYYDSPPQWLFTAHHGEALVGIRPVVTREILVGGEPVWMAGGIIPSVRERWRGQGHAQALTRHVLAWLDDGPYALSLAFVFEEALGAFLAPFGYRRVRARFMYEGPDGAQHIERQPAFARDLRGGELLERLEESDAIHLGRGCF